MTQVINDCPLLGNVRAVGIGLGAENGTAQYQFAGLALVKSVTSGPATWTQNDYVCSDPLNASVSIDNGARTPCPAGTIQVGFVYMNDSANTTSHLVMLSGFGVPGGQYLTPVYLTSNESAISSTTCTTITDGTHPMQWNIGANKNYRLTCEVPVNFAASAKVGFCLAGPSTPSGPTHLTLDAFWSDWNWSGLC